MTGQMNGLFTRAGDTRQTADGVAGRDLWEAGRVRREMAQTAAEKPAEKQVEKKEESSTAKAVRTKVAANRSVQEKYQEQISEERAAEAETEAVVKQLEWVGEQVVPEDVEELDDEGSVYDEYTAEQLERAIQRVKDGRAGKQADIARQVEKKQETREQIEKTALSQAEQKLAKRLEEAGMPVTQANLEKLSTALGLAEQAAPRLNEGSYSYLLENGLESSIENLYRASLLGLGSGVNRASTGWEMSGMAGGTENVPGAGDHMWAQIEPQAAAALEREGIPVTEEAMQEARWLFEHGLAIDGRNMAELQSLKGLTERAQTALSVAGQTTGASQAVTEANSTEPALAEPSSTEDIQDEIIEKLVDQAVVGGKPTETVLGDAREREARYAATKWSEMDFSNITQVTMRRQLEEVRLKMTTEAVLQLLKKGIHLDTENLSQIVEGLKELENSYYQKLCEEQGTEADSQMAALLQEVAEKRQESFTFSVYTMGSVYRSAGQITFEAFYEEGQRLTASLEREGTAIERIGDERIGERQARAGEAYETMATEVRSDLGDSIKKAFRNVDSLLESMEIAVNEANERAVRILGYNSLEITPESVAQMRYYDSRVTETLREMKPGTVLRMIRSGQNPLQMSMEELGDTIRELSDQSREDMSSGSRSKDSADNTATYSDSMATQEESYSRFLWKLEKQHGISEEERSSYIGIYRLLYQIEKSDGAAIGSVVGAGQELTLQNLLTAVRTRHSKGIDQRADENTGERETVTRRTASITEQIAAGYHQRPETGQAGATFGNEQLQQALAAETARQIRQTLEEPEADYREWQAEHLAEQVADSQEAVSFLQENGIESTPVLLEAAGELLGNDRKLEDFIEGLPAAERERLEQEGHRVLESLGRAEPEEFQAQVRQLQEAISEQIQQEKQAVQDSEGQVLTFERLQQLRTLGRAMSLSERLTGQEHYEIPMIQEDGSVSRIRLTVRHEGNTSARTASGTVALSMGLPGVMPEEPVKGNFWLQGGRLEGYFRCESRQTLEAVEQKLGGIQKALSAVGLEMGNLTCHLMGGYSSYHTGTDPISETRADQTGEQMGQTEQHTAQKIQQNSQKTQTVQLYEAARAVIEVLNQVS